MRAAATPSRYAYGEVAARWRPRRIGVTTPAVSPGASVSAPSVSAPSVSAKSPSSDTAVALAAPAAPAEAVPAPTASGRTSATQAASMATSSSSVPRAEAGTSRGASNPAAIRSTSSLSARSAATSRGCSLSGGRGRRVSASPLSGRSFSSPSRTPTSVSRWWCRPGNRRQDYPGDLRAPGCPVGSRSRACGCFATGCFRPVTRRSSPGGPPLVAGPRLQLQTGREPAHLPAERVPELQRGREQLQGAPEVVERFLGELRVEVVAEDGDAEPVHVHPQLVGAAGLGHEPVAAEPAGAGEQLHVRDGVDRAGLLVRADHPALLDDPAAHRARQLEGRVVGRDRLVGLAHPLVAEQRLVGAAPLPADDEHEQA